MELERGTAIASIVRSIVVSFTRPESVSFVAASRPKKMSKSCAIGRHASSSSGWAATMSVRLCTSSHRFRIPRLFSACASSMLRAG